MWADFMRQATANSASSPFPRPIGVTSLYVEPYTGETSTDSLEGYVSVVLKEDL